MKDKEAIPEFQAALQTNPSNLKALANLGNTFLTLRMYTEAIDIYTRAVRLAPNDFGVRTNLGIALQKAGRSKEAEKEFAEARRLQAAPKPSTGSQN